MKHHFVFLRHCVRSEPAEVDLGQNDRFSRHAKDYVGGPLPSWNVPMYWCTPAAVDMTKNTGEWLVETGIIKAGSHVELVANNVQRTIDTALALSVGIERALGAEGLAGTVTGLDMIHKDPEVFDTDKYGICTYVEEGDEEALQNRLDNLRRPDLDVREGLALLQKIAGKGKVGSLTKHIPTGATLDFARWDISGGSSLLQTFARILFYSRAGMKKQEFAPHATVKEVYQLLQYVHWHRAVVNVENNWSALAGAAWAKIILIVLSKGSLYGSNILSDSQLQQSDTVTLAVGHETQLDMFPTVFGVTWDLPEYYTHPEFVPTPPGSGFHIVRDTDTGVIEVSYIYPVYHKEGQEHWETNPSGKLRRSPVLWNASNSSSTFKSTSEVGLVPSLSDLESHFLSRLGEFEGAMECYDIISERFAPYHQPDTKTGTEDSDPFFESTVAVAILVAVVCCLAVALVLAILRRRSPQSSSPPSSPPAKTVENEGACLL